ncbi:MULTISPECIES: hypothetical protein [unclassified Mucilaginibacter]|uniref:hypothetical protein n=1 Tax=unclassified Mucilaginibacter TaxID=2617802 RepID=UPI00095ACD58|nr:MULTISPECIES: hypothetical protein [unclassified Mucilaginibacter]OJW18505.1 MAG: hypothetical protein BGO48_18405 [Mucilaginibacter sp. 44-25]PLW91059.1 MAG: hypothetical protein C0154_03160 [Mucilaginibacter sp.]HEK21310.1 hypothetical protein [Bacteroidota bacterium]
MSITTYGLQQIKKELQHLPAEQLAELCLRLTRYKKENKELLAYLLFDAHNEQDFIENVKAEAGFMFSQLPVQPYFTAKGLRKILKMLTKYIKFIGNKTAEVELLLNFCKNYMQYVVKQTSHKPIRLILTRQIDKIKTLLSKLHEDLQYDYVNDYEQLIADADGKYAWFSKKIYEL